MGMYTQGPWIWVDRWLVPVWDQDAIKTPSSSAIADDGSAYGEYGPVIDPKGSNARLIAAAPELLEALQDLVRAYEALPGAVTHNGSRHSHAVYAIRKALGEEK